MNTRSISDILLQFALFIPVQAISAALAKETCLKLFKIKISYWNFLGLTLLWCFLSYVGFLAIGFLINPSMNYFWALGQVLIFLIFTGIPIWSWLLKDPSTNKSIGFLKGLLITTIQIVAMWMTYMLLCFLLISLIAFIS